jgi:hypothetical protein
MKKTNCIKDRIVKLFKASKNIKKYEEGDDDEEHYDNRRQAQKAQKTILDIEKKILTQELTKKIKKENGITKENRKEYKKKAQQYQFITINPKDDIKFTELLDTIKDVLKKKWLKINYYVYEQRGETENEIGKGCHFHMICEKTKAKSRVIDILYNTCQYICGKRASIDVREFDKLGAIIRYNYITGKKKESKMKACDLNDKWRKSMKLKNLYTINEIKNIKNESTDIQHVENEIIEKEEQEEEKLICENYFKKESDEGYIYIKENGELIRYKLVKM